MNFYLKDGLGMEFIGELMQGALASYSLP